MFLAETDAPFSLPWFLSVVGAILVWVAGWYAGRAAEVRAAKREKFSTILRTYLDLARSDVAAKQTETRKSAYRAWALVEAGALTLETWGEFDRLLADAKAHGKEAPTAEREVSHYGLRSVLQLAVQAGTDLRAAPLSVSAFQLIAKAHQAGIEINTRQGRVVPDAPYPRKDGSSPFRKSQTDRSVQ